MKKNFFQTHHTKDQQQKLIDEFIPHLPDDTEIVSLGNIITVYPNGKVETKELTRSSSTSEEIKKELRHFPVEENQSIIVRKYYAGKFYGVITIIRHKTDCIETISISFLGK